MRVQKHDETAQHSDSRFVGKFIMIAMIADDPAAAKNCNITETKGAKMHTDAY